MDGFPCSYLLQLAASFGRRQGGSRFSTCPASHAVHTRRSVGAVVFALDCGGMASRPDEIGVTVARIPQGVVNLPQLDFEAWLADQQRDTGRTSPGLCVSPGASRRA